MNPDKEESRKRSKAEMEAEELRRRAERAETVAAEERRGRLLAEKKAEEQQQRAEEQRQRSERAEEERRRSEEKAEEQQQRAEEELRRHFEEIRLLEVAEYRRETSILRGNYYATIDQVWKVAANTYDDKSYFDQLKRQKAPSFYIRTAVATTQGPNVYSLTVDAAREEDNEPAFDARRSKHSGSSNTDNKDTIFNKDIFGNDEHAGPQLAHLIPHSKDHATLYVDVAIWALGLDESATPSNWQMWQKAIHGAIKPNKNRRTDHTGIKHFVANVICLSSQFLYFDLNPTVFIIPVMSEEDMKAWRGTAYSAIVVVGSKIFERNKKTKVHSNVVCKKIGMTNEGPLAAPDDIEKARILLGKVICGMAYWLKHMSKHIEDNLDDGAKEELQKLRQKFTSITGEGVVVPVPNQDPSQLKVRLVTFSDHNDPEGGHPAPDPLLLAAKAARNFTSFHDQPLKAAAEPQEEEWEKDELQQLAFEEYLDYCRNSYRPKTREDLARGLGQPFGYQQAQDEESKL